MSQVQIDQPVPVRVPRPRYTLSVLFILVLLVPGVLFFSPMSQSRPPVPRPASLGFAGLETYPVELRDYLQTQFPLRRELVMLHAQLRITLLGSSPSKKVILGREGWLYFADDGSLSSHRHTRPLTEQELAEWVTVLDRRHRMCQEVGATYYTLIIPDKHTIYPEYMPAGFGIGRGPSRLTQLIEYARIHAPHLNIPDLRSDLRDAKKVEQVYQKVDTHWNDVGAYIGYRHLMTAISRTDARLAPLGRDQFVTKTVTRPHTDLTDMLAVPDLYVKEMLGLTPLTDLGTETEVDRFTKVYTGRDSSLPSAVIYFDSFGIQLIPLLRPHFSKLVTRNALFFNYLDVDKYRPKIVIGEFVERGLSRPVQVDNNRVK